MNAYSYASDRRRYVSRKLSSIASRVRRVQLSKNGTPKIARPEDIELINGIQQLADMIELYAKNIDCNK
jgi:hypothetical protein